MTDDKKPSRKTRVIEAFLAALARKRWHEITLTEIAGDAGVSLAELREAFPTRTAILRAFSARIDAAVLREAAEEGDASEPARERLFDILMMRFEHLKPYRAALRNVREHAQRDPRFALKMGGQGLVTASWMLEGAGIPSTGPEGRRRVAGLPIVWARTFETFLEDQDPGLARTMATLDRHLRRAEERESELRRLRDRVCGLFGIGSTGRSRPNPDAGAGSRPGYERGFDAEAVGDPS